MLLLLLQLQPQSVTLGIPDPEKAGGGGGGEDFPRRLLLRLVSPLPTCDLAPSREMNISPKINLHP